jgi:hypothetical protein
VVVSIGPKDTSEGSYRAVGIITLGLISIPYLLLAIVRLFVSKLDQQLRSKVFVFRLATCAFAVMVAVFVGMLGQQLKLPNFVGQIAGMCFVIMIGEHLIYADLEKKKVLPKNPPRYPLSL